MLLPDAPEDSPAGRPKEGKPVVRPAGRGLPAFAVDLLTTLDWDTLIELRDMAEAQLNAINRELGRRG